MARRTGNNYSGPRWAHSSRRTSPMDEEPAPLSPEAYGSDVEYLAAIGELGGPMDEVRYAEEAEDED